MIQTKTARIFLHEGKITVVRIEKNLKQSLDDAKDNLAGAIEAGNQRTRPLLVDIRDCEPLEAHVRHYYSGKQLIPAFSALALLVDATPLGRMMGNVYFRVAKPGIPTQLFVDEEKALAWLDGYTK